MAEAELAAGGVNVVAFFAADGGLDFAGFEDVEKNVLSGLRRAHPREAFDGVVGDEVDLGAKTFRVVGEGMCLGVGVV